MIRTRWSASRKRTSVFSNRPKRSIYTCCGLLTRMSVTAGSAINDASGPTPSVSSNRSSTSRRRSSSFRGKSSTRRASSTNVSTNSVSVSSLAPSRLRRSSSSNSRWCKVPLTERYSAPPECVGGGAAGAAVIVRVGAAFFVARTRSAGSVRLDFRSRAASLSPPPAFARGFLRSLRILLARFRVLVSDRLHLAVA